MSIVLFQFNAKEKCDTSPEHMLVMLGHVGDLSGKSINGGVHWYELAEHSNPTVDGHVYIVNEDTFQVPGVTIVIEGITNTKEKECSKEDKETVSNIIRYVLDKMDIDYAQFSNAKSLNSRISVWTWENGNLTVHIDIDNKSLRDNLAEVNRKSFKVLSS